MPVTDNSEIITDYKVHGAVRSDMGKALDIVERLVSARLKPETLFADGGYPSVPTALEVSSKAVDFMTPVNRIRLPDNVMGRDHFKFDKNGFLSQCPMGQYPEGHRMRSANNQKGKSILWWPVR